MVFTVYARVLFLVIGTVTAAADGVPHSIQANGSVPMTASSAYQGVEIQARTYIDDNSSGRGGSIYAVCNHGTLECYQEDRLGGTTLLPQCPPSSSSRTASRKLAKSPVKGGKSPVKGGEISVKGVKGGKGRNNPVKGVKKPIVKGGKKPSVKGGKGTGAAGSASAGATAARTGPCTYKGTKFSGTVYLGNTKHGAPDAFIAECSAKKKTVKCCEELESGERLVLDCKKAPPMGQAPGATNTSAKGGRKGAKTTANANAKTTAMAGGGNKQKEKKK